MSRLFATALTIQAAIWLAVALALSGCDTPAPLTKGDQAAPPIGWTLQYARKPDVA